MMKAGILIKLLLGAWYCPLRLFYMAHSARMVRYASFHEATHHERATLNPFILSSEGAYRRTRDERSSSLAKYILLLIFFSSLTPAKTPRVTIITSLYNGDEFVEEFMQNMVCQSIFNDAELIIINAHSPGKEEHIIKKYLKAYPNIRYIRLSYDPGIYAVWNMAIHVASAPFIANANLDDRRTVNSLEQQILLLENNPDIDLVYCDYCYINEPNAQWYDLTNYPRTHFPEFEPRSLRKAIAGPQPVWRKAVHEKVGYFKEDFIASADQEMWCRMADAGSKFMKASCISGLYYENPHGISSDPDEKKTALRKQEDEWILQKYAHLWAE